MAVFINSDTSTCLIFLEIGFYMVAKLAEKSLQGLFSTNYICISGKGKEFYFSFSNRFQTIVLYMIYQLFWLI